MHITRNNCDVFQAITILKLLQIYLKSCYQQFCTRGDTGASPTRENALIFLFFLLIFYV